MVNDRRARVSVKNAQTDATRCCEIPAASKVLLTNPAKVTRVKTGREDKSAGMPYSTVRYGSWLSSEGAVHIHFFLSTGVCGALPSCIQEGEF